VLVYPTGYVFRFLWNIVKVFLDPVTRNKIRPLANIEDLKQFVEPQYLLRSLGGTSDYEFDPNDPVGEPRLWENDEGDYYPLQTRLKTPNCSSL
jgi:hypothetical protein